MTAAASPNNTRAFVRRLLNDQKVAKQLIREWFVSNGARDECLNALSGELARAYAAGEVPFDLANSSMSELMNLREWKAPPAFWELFVAFEDLEISEDPGLEGLAHVATALERFRSQVGQGGSDA